MEEKRARAMELLSNYVHISKNVQILEHLIYIYSQSNKKYLYSTEDMYDMILYQCMIYLKNGKSITELGECFVQDKLGFKHTIFDKLILNQLEHDNYIEHPIDSTEGVFECSRCKSNHIITFQKQTRRADEGFTIFNTCVKCNHKWKIN